MILNNDDIPITPHEIKVPKEQLEAISIVKNDTVKSQLKGLKHCPFSTFKTENKRRVVHDKKVRRIFYDQERVYYCIKLGYRCKYSRIPCSFKDYSYCPLY